MDYRKFRPAEAVTELVHVFLISHTSHADAKELLGHYLEYGKKPGFPGLSNFTRSVKI